MKTIVSSLKAPFGFAVPSKSFRSAVSNGRRLHHDADGRSAKARRFRDLIIELSAEYRDGESLSVAERGAIRQAAAIMVRAEEIQAAVVRGEPINDDVLIRLSSEVRRILVALRRRDRKSTTLDQLPLRERLHGGAG